MSVSISRKNAEKFIARVNALLSEGHPPQHLSTKNRLGAVAVAAREFKIPPATAKQWFTNGTLRKFYNLEPDWSLYRDPELDPSPVETETAREIRRLKDLLAITARERDSALRELNRHQTLTARIDSIVSTKIKPPTFKARRKDGEKYPEIPFLFHSDTQYGEVIDPDEMDGLNSYNAKIAAKRIERMFQAFVDLTLNHWSGPKAEIMFYLRGGDHVSGEIHDGLRITNDKHSLEAIHELEGLEVAGIELIRRELKCPVHVISVSGNHGRTTIKPTSKKMSATNYDYLLAKMIQRWFERGDKHVSFLTPVSGDALFKMYEFRCLLTHGDRIGSRGGQGFIGPVATIARGAKKLTDSYADLGVKLYRIFMGHFHTRLELERVIVNGSMPGFSQFARDNRMSIDPAMQVMGAVHPKRGLTYTRSIQVGHPSEGSLYG